MTDIPRIKQILRNAVTEDIQDFVLNVHGILRNNPPKGTPVETGWASNNWIPSVGGFSKEPVGEPGSVNAAQAASDAGVGALLTWELGDGPIYVVNNVPYITALNRGHSGQSPAGFVEAAIDEALDQFGRGDLG